MADDDKEDNDSEKEYLDTDVIADMADDDKEDNDSEKEDLDIDVIADIFSTGTSEASQELGRIFKIILPDGIVIHKRVLPMETAYEFKESCLGKDYLSFKELSVFLCRDSPQIDTEKNVPDEAQFGDLLDDYEFIRIRSSDNEDTTNSALQPSIKMKT
ncbi:hypothetical protein Btru_037709 [Bulinus truncatus]|nr:hypothetical protein Btru_037709 [Bulinus truncatus]